MSSDLSRERRDSDEPSGDLSSNANVLFIADLKEIPGQDLNLRNVDGRFSPREHPCLRSKKQASVDLLGWDIINDGIKVHGPVVNMDRSDVEPITQIGHFEEFANYTLEDGTKAQGRFYSVHEDMQSAVRECNKNSLWALGHLRSHGDLLTAVVGEIILDRDRTTDDEFHTSSIAEHLSGVYYYACEQGQLLLVASWSKLKDALSEFCQNAESQPSRDSAAGRLAGFPFWFYIFIL